MPVYTVFELKKQTFDLNIHWNQQLPVISSVMVREQNPTIIVGLIRVIKSEGLFTDTADLSTFNVVVEHSNPWAIADLFKIMKMAGLLTGVDGEVNRSAVLTIQQPERIIRAITTLRIARLLTQDNFLTVIKHKNPEVAAIAIERLSIIGLTTKYTDVVLRNRDPVGVVNAIKLLNEVGFLAGSSAQNNMNAVLDHPATADVVTALETLNACELLNQDNFTAMMSCKHPAEFADALRLLNFTGLLTNVTEQDDARSRITHQQPWNMACALNILSLAGIDNHANRDAVSGNQCPIDAACALKSLSNANFFTGSVPHDYLNLIKQHNNLKSVIEIIDSLNSLELLSDNTMETFYCVVINHNNPKAVVSAIKILSQVGLLCHRNVNAVLGHRYPLDLVEALSNLQQSGSLDSISAQDNFNAVVGQEDPQRSALNLVELNRLEDRSLRTSPAFFPPTTRRDPANPYVRHLQ